MTTARIRRVQGAQSFLYDEGREPDASDRPESL
jgi:hypothetical protein